MRIFNLKPTNSPALVKKSIQVAVKFNENVKHLVNLAEILRFSNRHKPAELIVINFNYLKCSLIKYFLQFNYFQLLANIFSENQNILRTS